MERRDEAGSTGAGAPEALPTWVVLVVPLAAFGVAKWTGRVAHRVMRQLAEDATQGRARWWLAGGPEAIARIVHQFVAATALVVLVLLAVFLFRRPTRATLGLVAGRVPVAAWWLLAAATFSFALGAAGLVEMLARLARVSEESPAVNAFFDLVRRVPPLLAALLVLGSAGGAAFAEELAFRGWLQNQLLERFGPRAAVFVTALVFAAAHLEPARVIYAFVLGLWLGYVALRTGSVLPAALCHAAVNGTSLVLFRLAGDLDPARFSVGGWTVFWGIAALSVALAIVSFRVLERAGRAGPSPR